MWGKRETVHKVIVVVDEINVDEAVAKIEKAAGKLEVRREALLHTIALAKAANTQLETTMAAAARAKKGRSWG